MRITHRLTYTFAFSGQFLFIVSELYIMEHDEISLDDISLYDMKHFQRTYYTLMSTIKDM